MFANGVKLTTTEGVVLTMATKTYSTREEVPYSTWGEVAEVVEVADDRFVGDVKLMVV